VKQAPKKVHRIRQVLPLANLKKIRIWPDSAERRRRTSHNSCFDDTQGLPVECWHRIANSKLGWRRLSCDSILGRS
jgi:hypothetical protein